MEEYHYHKKKENIKTLTEMCCSAPKRRRIWLLYCKIILALFAASLRHFTANGISLQKNGCSAMGTVLEEMFYTFAVFSGNY